MFLIDNKDAVLLMLLPDALKSSDAPVTAQQAKRARKIETEKAIQARKESREQFIVHVEVSFALQNYDVIVKTVSKLYFNFQNIRFSLGSQGLRQNYSGKTVLLQVQPTKPVFLYHRCWPARQT